MSSIVTGPPFAIISIASSCGGTISAVAAVPAQALPSEISAFAGKCISGTTIVSTSVQGDPTQAVISAIGANPGYVLAYVYTDSACKGPSTMASVNAIVGAPDTCIVVGSTALSGGSSSGGSVKWSVKGNNTISLYQYDDSACSVPVKNAGEAVTSLPAGQCAPGTAETAAVKTLQDTGASSGYEILRTSFDVKAGSVPGATGSASTKGFKLSVVVGTVILGMIAQFAL